MASREEGDGTDRTTQSVPPESPHPEADRSGRVARLRASPVPRTIDPRAEGTPGNPVRHSKPGPSFGAPEKPVTNGAFRMEIHLDLRAVIVVLIAIFGVLVVSAYDANIRDTAREWRQDLFTGSSSAPTP